MSAPFALGCFTVRAEAPQVEAFRDAIGLAACGDVLPLTFPIRWLAAPQVRASLAAMVPEPDLVPFHESQSFDFAAPLRVDAPYTMTLTARREAEPDRLVVEAIIAAPNGITHATCETILRLFSVAGAAA